MQPTLPYSELIKVDQFVDRLPVLSTISNIYIIFEKQLLIPILKEYQPDLIATNHYYTYLEEKSLVRCIILLIPGVGNLIIYLYDWACPDDGKALAVAILAKEGKALEYGSAELRSDKEAVRIALKQWGTALQYADVKIQDDDEMVRSATKSSFGIGFMYASDRLRGDKPFILELIKEGLDSAFEYASSELRGDREVVEAAIEASPYNLEFVSDELKNDKPLVLKAVKDSYHGNVLCYASPALQQDPDLFVYV